MSLLSEIKTGLRTLHTTLDSWLEARDRAYTERVSLHDWDLPLDGADYLAGVEAEIDSWEPRMEAGSIDAAEPPFPIADWERDFWWSDESSPVASATSAGDGPRTRSEGSGSRGEVEPLLPPHGTPTTQKGPQ